MTSIPVKRTIRLAHPMRPMHLMRTHALCHMRPMQVDAALDATNVARVAHYIRDKTRMGPTAAMDGSEPGESPAGNRFQSIVISLKVQWPRKHSPTQR